MAEDLISSIFDEPAIKKQLDDTNKQLDELALKLKQFPTISIGGSATSLKDLTAQNKEYEKSLSGIANTQKAVLDSEKLAAVERKKIADERTQQARTEAANLKLQQIEIKKKEIAEKEAAIASKNAAAESVAAGRERILQLKAEQEALQKAADAEKQRNAAEQSALSGTYNPGSTPKPKSTVFVQPLTIDQGNIVLVKQYESAIAKLVAEQNLAKIAFKSGQISQAEYSRQIAVSTEKVNLYKANVSDLNREMKLAANVNNSERNSLQRAQALVLQYTNEKKKLNLATSDGILLNNNYNKAIAASNAFILKNADAETVRAKSVGLYTQGIQKAFSGLRTLANILPGVGLSGLFLAGYEAIKYLVQEMGLFNDKLFSVSKQTALLSELNKTAADSAGKESASLRTLRIEIENTKVPMANRLQGIKNIREQYPEYFKGLTNEQILNGKVGNSYDLVTASILRKARASAASTELEKTATEKFAILMKSENDAIETNVKLSKAQAQTRVVSGGTGGVGGTSIALDKAAVQREIKDRYALRKKSAQDEIDEILKKEAFLLKQITQFGGEEIKVTKEKEAKKTSVVKESTKALLDTDFEIYKIAQQRKIKLLDDGVNDESKSYDERIALLQDFTNESQALINAQLENDLRAQKEKLKTQQSNASKSTGTDKNNLLIEIANTNTAIQVLEAKAADERLKTFDSNEKRFQEVLKSANAQEEKLRKEKYENELSDAQAGNAEIKAALSREYEGLNQVAIDRYTSGKLTQKQFNEERIKLDFDYQRKAIKNELQFAKEILDIQKSPNAGIDTAKQQEAVAKLATDLESLYNNAAIKEKDIKLQKDKEYADKKKDLYKQLYSEIQQTIFQFLDDGLKREEQDLDERKRLLDEDAKRKIANVNQLGLSEVERVKQTAAIEKQAQFESEQIEKRKRAIAVERAKFEKAANIASIISGTAKAIVEVLGNPFLVALVASIGALQLARAISTPLPKYFKGTESAQKGPGVYGEIGRELVIPQSGKPYLSPGVATLTSFIGGEKIIPADITASILNATGMQRLASMDQSKPITQDSVNGHLMGKMLGELKDLNRKSRIVINNSREIKTTAWYQQQFKN